MSDYNKITDYAAKDSLSQGDAVKRVKGSEIGADFDAVAVAVATKANSASPVFTGVSGFAVGAVGAPSIYMTGYATTGWYNIGANNWGFAVSGAKVLDIGTSGIDISATAARMVITSTTGTNSSSTKYVNTGGAYYVGVNDSAAVVFGGTAYSLVRYAPAGKVIQDIINGIVVSTISSTGLAVTGDIDISATAARMVITSTTGTNSSSTKYVNTGGAYYVGVNDSAAVVFGGTAYSLVRYAPAGKVIQDIIDGIVVSTISSTGLAVTGDISVSTKTPASAAAAGVAGTITWDANYIYVCTATNTWKRVAIATW